MPRATEPAVLTATQLRGELRINEEEIERCIMTHSEWVDKVGQAAVAAAADRDYLKLQLKETVAELDQAIRKKAIDDDEKLSEKAVENRIIVLPKIKELNRKFLDADRKAADLDAIREAFRQRSYALRELNGNAQARLFNLGLERGASNSRARVMEQRGTEVLNNTREERGVFERRGATSERFRPRDQGG